MGGGIKGVYGGKYEDIKVYSIGLGYRFRFLNLNFDIEICKGLWFF